MIRSNSVYSAAKTLRLKQREYNRSRLGIRDLSYFAVVLWVSGVLVTNVVTKATQVFAYQTPNPQTIIQYQTAKPDERIEKLRIFLESKNSPLAPYASLIISQSDLYALDWTRIVAISGMESHYGVQVPKNSYNAWGLGGNNFIYFTSWEEGIKFEAKTLGSNYKLNENQGIKDKYCPAKAGCNEKWAKIVTDTSKKILEGK